MKDPYLTLGISRGASDAEIKKAYRTQCKRWHPDLNPGNPQAEEKFKEVQAAYDAITKGEPQNSFAQGGAYQQGYGAGNPYAQRGTHYGNNTGASQGQYNDPFGFGGFGFGNFGGFGGYTQGQTSGARYASGDSPELQAARNYIINGQYAQARHILDSIQTRGARWYYFSALTYSGLGNHITSLAYRG